MKHRTPTRMMRMVAVLFGLSLVLSACDAEHVLALLDGTAARPDAKADVARHDGAANARPRAAKKKPTRSTGRRDAGAADGAAAAGGTPADSDRATPPAGRRPDGPAPAAGADAATPSGALSAVEQGIVDRLMVGRRQAGLAALAVSATISRGARTWSCDMATSGDFRHADLRTAGVYGENIAWGQRTAAEVHDGWMNSPGHRDNRMSPRWTEYGVGVCKNSSGRLYFTERFR